ncbi:MAG: 50S ribosomal protein L19 [Polyangiaceae bacterium]
MEVTSHGIVRRARLFYLRKLSGRQPVRDADG